MRQEKEIKGIQFGNKEVKASLFINNIIFTCKKKNVDSTKQFLELVCLNTVIEYKFNIQKWLYFYVLVITYNLRFAVKFHFAVPWYHFLHDSSAWAGLSFVDLCICSLHKIWENCGLHFFKYFLKSPLLSGLHLYIYKAWYCPTAHWKKKWAELQLFIYFIDNYVFKFTTLFFYSI